ncbi:hypothetical protein [Burkholderia gladioli]|uniref:hypothetical protein n=1 Tax=Burkholderia gladioli TaxID=28095 RepID=UPI00163DF4FA|nr:hypothetical protein [Burkholderia gladioli]
MKRSANASTAEFINKVRKSVLEVSSVYGDQFPRAFKAPEEIAREFINEFPADDEIWALAESYCQLRARGYSPAVAHIYVFAHDPAARGDNAPNLSHWLQYYTKLESHIWIQHRIALLREILPLRELWSTDIALKELLLGFGRAVSEGDKRVAKKTFSELSNVRAFKQASSN